MSREKHGGGVEQACQMLDIFTQTGVRSFDLTQTDIDGLKRRFTAGLNTETLRGWMPALLKLAAERQYNVIIRPRSNTIELVQLDDLNRVLLERVAAVAFLILATSPGNYQAWVAVREGGRDSARQLRHGSGADPSASGATRIAGSLNFKRKYAPDFPTVTILKARPNRITTTVELEQLGLVGGARRPAPPGRVSSPSQARQWPSYQRCLQNAPHAHNSDRPDVSRADFTFSVIAIDWGWSVAETCERLLVDSTKARENGEAYARRTAERAAAVVQRRKLAGPESS